MKQIYFLYLTVNFQYGEELLKALATNFIMSAINSSTLKQFYKSRLIYIVMGCLCPQTQPIQNPSQYPQNISSQQLFLPPSKPPTIPGVHNQQYTIRNVDYNSIFPPKPKINFKNQQNSNKHKFLPPISSTIIHNNNIKPNIKPPETIIQKSKIVAPNPPNNLNTAQIISTPINKKQQEKNLQPNIIDDNIQLEVGVTPRIILNPTRITKDCLEKNISDNINIRIQWKKKIDEMNDNLFSLSTLVWIRQVNQRIKSLNDLKISLSTIDKMPLKEISSHLQLLQKQNEEDEYKFKLIQNDQSE